jgi:glutamyl-tRNA synthetase
MNVPTDSLTDPVILRSNGIPMYNFSVVIDDFIMQITHIFRGEEHLSNTPYQIVIRELVTPILLQMGYPKVEDPIFGHLSIIVNETGKKLSKRDTSLRQFIYGSSGDDYISLGYHPQAICNFITLLGRSPMKNEIIS